MEVNKVDETLSSVSDMDLTKHESSLIGGVNSVAIQDSKTLYNT